MKKNNKRLKRKSKNIIIMFCILISLIILFIWLKPDKKIYMSNLVGNTIEEAKQYALVNKLDLDIKYDYSDNIDKNIIINQSIKEDTLLNENDKLTVTVSLGPIPVSLYKRYKVNELGRVPIMMYHGIYNLKNSDTIYTGGNVDKDGYNRTTEAFMNDLEMYYQKGYRMIRLQDYINGNINIEIGKSPIILTFDDGSPNNFRVLGKDEKGNLMIDPYSAVGILESFKNKYKDYNVTATFFLNSGLFGQAKYNEEILNWLVDHGYDIGNHTKDHNNLSLTSTQETVSCISYMYQLFDRVIPNKYVKIVALPLGRPYEKSHANFPLILNGNNDGYTYKTEATLRVGWMPETSPFDTKFDKTYLMRVRAWDNNGKDDIEKNFKDLESTRYISSGKDNFIVIPKSKSNRVNTNINKKVITYE